MKTRQHLTCIKLFAEIPANSRPALYEKIQESSEDIQSGISDPKKYYLVAASQQEFEL